MAANVEDDEFYTWSVMLKIPRHDELTLSSISGSMLASGVDGDITTVLSDVFAVDEAPDVPVRL